MATADSPGTPPGMTAEKFEDHCRLAARARSALREHRGVLSREVEVDADGVRVDAVLRPVGDAAPLAGLLTDPHFSVADFDWGEHSQPGGRPVRALELTLCGEVRP